ncbi:RND family efflux transporter MFP subunit [Rhodoligotrophos appendicifer]|uniref:efflux RND transporter periplasmic adaptor subunit n=1 Tax=Rhodoligotrophos appendicifer TaxID=987056 RepID=UPI00117D0EB9|nr:efflux RND transporter periplasmic adaptor subunit [Rhodoligotrophos appendicifer]
MNASFTRLSAVAVPVLAGLILGACSEQQAAESKAEPPRPVQVTRVILAPAQDEKTFVGTVKARHESALGFRLAGKITARLVNVGETVKAGQSLARLDPEDLSLELQSAEAELAAAQSNLTQTSAEADRYDSLLKRGFTSAAEFDRKTLAKQEAVGRLERARRSLDLARNRLGYAELLADHDGIIVETAAEPGQVVAAGQTVIRLARLDEREAVVSLPETVIAEARNAHATVSLWADPGKRYEAVLRELAPQADAGSRTYAARFTIRHPDDTIALGMTATVTLRAPGPEVARLPLSAVFNQGGGAQVYVVEPTRHVLERRPVKIAAYTEDAALVSEGLEADEEVVSLGVHKLNPGATVRTIDAP